MRSRSHRQAIGALVVAVLIGASSATGATGPAVPKHVTIVETVYVFNTENHGRSVSALLKTNTILSVSGQVVRNGTVLASRKQVLPAGSHDLVIGIPGGVAAGPATLALTFTDELQRTKTTTQAIHIPRRT